MITPTQIFRSLLLAMAVTLFLILPVLSNPDIVVQPIGSDQVALPDMENWTLGTMPGVDSENSTASLLNLGTLIPLGAEQFSLKQTAAFSGVDVKSMTLDQFPLASEQTLSDLILGNGDAPGVRNLGRYTMEEVPAIANLLQANPQIGGINLEQSLSDFAKSNPLSQTLKLNELGDLSQIQIGEIPNLMNTPLKNFADWDGSLGLIDPNSTLITSIPGLGDIPLSQFPISLDLTVVYAARIDTVRGEAETAWERTVTGSDLVGFEFPCTTDDPNTTACSHLELDDIENVGEPITSKFEGRAWINGQYQWVEGGYGALQTFVFPGSAFMDKPGLEPTGRFPFGDFAKLVLWSVDETTDSAQFVLFLRYCNALGCTPYNLGPLPFMSYKRNALIPIGDLNPLPSVQHPSISGQFNQSLAIEQQLAQEQVIEEVPFLKEFTTAQLEPAQLLTGEEVTGGISAPKLAEGILSVFKSKNPDNISNFRRNSPSVTCLPNNLCGKSLGQYGLHSTLPAVTEVILAKPGGDRFLKTLAKPGRIDPQQLREFFPQAEQDAIMHSLIGDAALHASREIDPTTGQEFCGGRLVERTAQVLAGGGSSPIDSQATNVSGTHTLQSFGQEVQTYYSANGGMSEC